MVKSGIKCEEAVKSEFARMNKSKKEYRYIIFKIDKEGEEYTKVVVEKVGDRSKTFQDMKEDLDANSARFVVFDLCYHTKCENQLREKIVFLSFVSSDASLKDKLIYAATKEEVKRNLSSLSLVKDYDALCDLNEDEIKQEMATKGY